MALTGGRDAGPPLPVVLAVCAAVLAPTLTFRMGVDQGVFAYMGNALLQGGWPYVDTWESDFPGLIFLQAAEIFVLGKSIVAFRFVDLLVQIGNAYLIYRMAARVRGRLAAFTAAVLFCLIYQGYGPWNTAQREGFALLFVLSGFWAYFTADRRPPEVTAAAIGLGLGIAVTIKPTILALSLFYLPLLLDLRSFRALTTVIAAGIGLAAPAAVIVGRYWFAGRFSDLYEACIAYQAIYTARLRGPDPIVTYWLGKLSQFGLNSIVLPVVYVPFLFIGTARRERLMIWLGYMGSLYAVFVQGTFAGYHYLPGMALGAILVGTIVSFLADRVLGARHLQLAGRRVSAQTVAVTLMLAAAGGYYLRMAPYRALATLEFLEPPQPGEFRIGTVFDFTESYDAATYMRDRTQPDDPIQVWGYESLVYYLADRRAASRFQMTHPLVMRAPGGSLTPMQQRWRDEFVRDMQRRRPSYVAVVKDDHWWWAPDERSSEQLLDDFPEWQRIIQHEYTLEQTIGRFLIYRRTSGTPAEPAQ